MNTTLLGKAFNFNVCFRDCTLTANAGLVLLRDFIARLGLPDLLDREINIKARQRGYPESEQILALCWNAILGGDCLRDLDVLRGDAGINELLGISSLMAPTTAGDFLRQFDLGDLSDLRRLNRLVAQRVRPLQTSTRVTLDLDASLYQQCSTRKQGSRMNYKGEVGYYPLFAFWAEEQELLATHLLRGNTNAPPSVIWLLKQALASAPTGKARFLRADSEFYVWELIEFCEQEQITYTITADQTASLKAAIEGLEERAWKRYAPGVEVAEFTYQPAQRKAHRYVVKRQWRKEGKQAAAWRYHVVVTNDGKRGAKKLMQWALQRCAMENLIKEHKRDFGFEKMPSQRYHGNWAWLLISQLAWNVMAWFKRCCLPAQCHRLTVASVRHRLLKVAAKIVHQGRQLYLVISDENRFKDWWRFALKQLAKIQPISP